MTLSCGVDLQVLYVYCPMESSRLDYILAELLGRRLGLRYHIYRDMDVFKLANGPKINYSETGIENVLQIVPHTLLFEKDIRPQEIIVREHPKHYKVFFQTAEGKMFDIFAASFYLLSRYEEYGKVPKDEHGRFKPEHSLAVQQGFLQKPLVDLWCLSLKQKLLDYHSGIQFNQPAYTFMSTIDVDFLYKYKGYGLLRQILKSANSLVRGKWHEIVKQAASVFGIMKDPYDTYDYIRNILSLTGQKPFYFVLMGNKSKYDKTLSPQSRHFRHWFEQYGKSASVGLHPSYRSNRDITDLDDEKKILATYLGKSPETCRQHFLMLTVPDAPKRLIRCGFREDFSMGYSSHTGFRASTSHPFGFFNLEENTSEELLFYPVTVMDVTLKNYLGYTPGEAALGKIKELITSVKEVNGLFISIWHNSSFDEPEWKGWKEVFEKMHTLAASV